MARGVLWVSSRITQPSSLTPAKFCDWYENRHIQEVLSLSGIPSATRYQALQPQPSPETWSSDAPWLTVYEMSDLDFCSTAEFKSLDGQSVPSEDLLKGIFKCARFDTRAYREVQCFENPNVSADEKQAASGRSVRWLISAALEPAESEEARADFDEWYRKEHLDMLALAKGFVRTRRYELVEGSTLDEFVRTEHDDVPKYLALHEFCGEELPWKELDESAKTEWAKKVMGNLKTSEVGWYELKREYGEETWGKVGM